MLSQPHRPQHSQRTPERLNVVPSLRWRAPVEDEVGSWPITFSDLVLLLLCFFILWHVAEKQHSARAVHSEPPLNGQQTILPLSMQQASTQTLEEPPAIDYQQQQGDCSEQHPQLALAEQTATPPASVAKADWQA